MIQFNVYRALLDAVESNKPYALIRIILYSIYWMYALSWEAQQTEPRHSGTQAT
jgi:hypothetical protein